MNKKPKILFFCMIFVGGSSLAQHHPLKNNNLLLLLQQKNLSWKPSLPGKSTAPIVKIEAFLSPDFYAKQLGFFCKQEIKLDKVTKVPFRFRLGSIEECDWLEGKRKKL